MLRFVFLLLLVATEVHPLSKKGGFYEAIGVKTLSFFDASRAREVLVELWYPTHHVGPIDPHSDELWIHPKEIRNASYLQTTRKFPLIMMSHGHGGDRRDRSWLADELVRNGYIVASVEHFGNNRAHYDPLITLRFWDRPKDIIFALDELLKMGEIESKIDRKKIGFVGYSLGGLTGLSLAGAMATHVKEKILEKQKILLPEANPKYIEGVDFKEAEKSYREPRLKAFLLICPATFAFSPKTLKQIKVPVGLIAAEEDAVLPFDEHANRVIRHISPKKLKVMSKVSHHVFLNRVTKKGKALMKYHEDHPEKPRESVHEEVALFAVKFFSQYL